jgi:Transposase C of IS166 homeodomain
VTPPADTLPDDPGLLKAMLLAERAESERLRQSIRELQRHRFGRRAEALPEDQLLLASEELEQVEAADPAKAEESAPAEREARTAKRRANQGALPAHLPRIETVVDVESLVCPWLARARCTASAGTVSLGTPCVRDQWRTSAWMSCRRSSGFWWCAGPHTPAVPART